MELRRPHGLEMDFDSLSLSQDEVRGNTPADGGGAYHVVFLLKKYFHGFMFRKARGFLFDCSPSVWDCSGSGASRATVVSFPNQTQGSSSVHLARQKNGIDEASSLSSSRRLEFTHLHKVDGCCSLPALIHRLKRIVQSRSFQCQRNVDVHGGIFDKNLRSFVFCLPWCPFFTKITSFLGREVWRFSLLCRSNFAKNLLYCETVRILVKEVNVTLVNTV